MIKGVRISTLPDSQLFGSITLTDTGESVRHVRDINISWSPGEPPMATLEVVADLDLVVDATFVPVFVRDANRPDGPVERSARKLYELLNAWADQEGGTWGTDYHDCEPWAKEIIDAVFGVEGTR